MQDLFVCRYVSISSLSLLRPLYRKLIEEGNDRFAIIFREDDGREVLAFAHPARDYEMIQTHLYLRKLLHE